MKKMSAWNPVAARRAPGEGVGEIVRRATVAAVCLGGSVCLGLTESELDRMPWGEKLELIRGTTTDDPVEPDYEPSFGPLPREIGRVQIDTAWAGHPTGFALVTTAERQYAAYYNGERRMVVAARDLGSTEWDYAALPTYIGWDSHNYIRMALDRDGRLHLSGNLHNDPLIYFRTREPHAIGTFEAIHRMTGEDESGVTYPRFFEDADGRLIFTYRQGSSGSGFNVYNRYDTESGEWERLHDQPLLDGRGEMNAYPIGPLQGPDGVFHMTWVWRDTPDAATNHDLSYARSRDLVHWETAAGEPVALPLTLETPGLILDPIPVNGGILNGSGRIGFDHEGRVIVTYFKFDEEGKTQIYNARLVDGEWDIRQATDWDYRWEFGGGGSLPNPQVRHAEVKAGEDGLILAVRHPVYPGGVFRVDEDSLKLGERVPPSPQRRRLEARIGEVRGEFPGLEVRKHRFPGPPGSGLSYVLRNETLPQNRDRPRPEPWPEPSPLELITILENEPEER